MPSDPTVPTDSSGVDLARLRLGSLVATQSSFRFDRHLHNGDLLTHRTAQRPPGRPPVWNPPNDRDSSTIDALMFEGFANEADWSLPRTLVSKQCDVAVMLKALIDGGHAVLAAG